MKSPTFVDGLPYGHLLKNPWITSRIVCALLQDGSANGDSHTCFCDTTFRTFLAMSVNTHVTDGIINETAHKTTTKRILNNLSNSVTYKLSVKQWLITENHQQTQPKTNLLRNCWLNGVFCVVLYIYMRWIVVSLSYRQRREKFVRRTLHRYQRFSEQFYSSVLSFYCNFFHIHVVCLWLYRLWLCRLIFFYYFICYSYGIVSLKANLIHPYKWYNVRLNGALFDAVLSIYHVNWQCRS